MTVRQLPVADAFLTREELAAELKVHPRTIDRWRREGMPSELWGGPRSRTRRFPLSACLAWVRSGGSATVPIHSNAGATAGTAPRHGTGKEGSHAPQA